MSFTQTLSTPQYNFVNDPSHDVFCNALPGSGKSFCLATRAKLWMENEWFGDNLVLLMCFNREIEQEWRKLKLGIHTSTSHSLGKKLLGEILRSHPQIDVAKYQDLYDLNYKESVSLSGVRKKVLFHENSKHDLMMRIEEQLFLNEVDPLLVERSKVKVYNAWRKGINCMETMIDYDDMLFGPFELIAKNPENFNKIRTKYQYLLVDEFQDLSLFQWKLHELIGVEHVWVVGDENQGIFSWNGSDSMLGRSVADKFNCVDFTLNQSRRCPHKIAEYASRYVPEFEALNSNPRGVLHPAYEDNVANFDLNGSTVIISRANAPLMEISMKMLEKNEPFQFKQDVTKPIINFLKFRTKETMTLPKAHEVFQNYLDKRTGILKTQDLNMSEEEIERFDTVLALTGKYHMGVRTIKDLVLKLKGLKNSKKGLQLSSIHGAKGLEWDNVICLNHHDLDKKVQKDEMSSPHSEISNLAFVTTTRSKKEMAFRNTENIINHIETL